MTAVGATKKIKIKDVIMYDVMIEVQVRQVFLLFRLIPS